MNSADDLFSMAMPAGKISLVKRIQSMKQASNDVAELLTLVFS